MPIVEINNGPIGYDEAGAGPAVVLLHAGIADRRMWEPLRALLPGRYRVIAYDLRGYGESSPPTDSFAHHDDVAAVLDRLGIERAALVGCSFGGRVAVDAALAHPDRVGALALFGSVVSGYRWSELNELWDRVVGEVDESDFAALAAAEVRLWAVGPDRTPADVDPAMVALAEDMDRLALAAEAALEKLDVRQLDPPAVDRLVEVSAPTLVAVGAHEVPEVRRLADRLAAEIPQARRLADIPGGAHLVPLERPQPVAAALIDFLDADGGR